MIWFRSFGWEWARTFNWSTLLATSSNVVDLSSNLGRCRRGLSELMLFFTTNVYGKQKQCGHNEPVWFPVASRWHEEPDIVGWEIHLCTYVTEPKSNFRLFAYWANTNTAQLWTQPSNTKPVSEHQVLHEPLFQWNTTTKLAVVIRLSWVKWSSLSVWSTGMVEWATDVFMFLQITNLGVEVIAGNHNVGLEVIRTYRQNMSLASRDHQSVWAYTDTMNKHQRFSRLLLTRTAPSNQIEHEKLVTEF